jgi:PhnB protein
MLSLTPYLLFDGTCLQAMQFYQSCLGGELTVMTVKDSPASKRLPAALEERIINARLRGDGVDISASDWLRPDRAPARGNTVCLYLSAAGRERIEGAFARLSDGAEVTDPLSGQFFGLYGALNDRFGVRWMFRANVTSQEGAA